MWTPVVKKKALHAGVYTADAFGGTGVDDLVVSGTTNFAANRQYMVTIDSTANQTFKWSNDNGATWEETGVSIASIESGKYYELVNAEHEKEGLKIRFSGGAVGHVNNDYWAFHTTGNVVSATEAAVSDLIVNAGAAEELIVRGEYKKGTETGLILYIKTPMEYTDSVLHRPGAYTDIGDGGLLYHAEYIRMDADANYVYRFNLTGISHYRLYQIRYGSAAVSGLFTAFAETYKIAR